MRNSESLTCGSYTKMNQTLTLTSSRISKPKNAFTRFWPTVITAKPIINFIYSRRNLEPEIVILALSFCLTFSEVSKHRLKLRLHNREFTKVLSILHKSLIRFVFLTPIININNFIVYLKKLHLFDKVLKSMNQAFLKIIFIVKLNIGYIYNKIQHFLILGELLL